LVFSDTCNVFDFSDHLICWYLCISLVWVL